MNIQRSLLIPFILLIFMFPARATDQQQVVMSKVPPPPIAARSWLLIDHDSGAVLAAGDPDMRVEPASLTKLMTAYIVFRELAEGRRTLDEKVYISEKAWRMEGSRMFAKVNSRIRLEDLVMGMIVQSGNDATVALAEHIGGSEESFIGLMNQTAAELDMSGTHFMNSSGMPDAEHFTTAADLAKLTRALIHDYPEYYRYYAIEDFTWNDIKQGNRNILLSRDATVDGVKTGHTESAGYCLIGSAKRDDMRLIAVVIGADSKLARADLVHSLLNYGFGNYVTREVYPAGKMVQNVTLYKGAVDSIAAQTRDAIFLTVPRRDSDEITQTVTVPDYVLAPVAAGQSLGEISFSLAGRKLGAYPLIAVSSVDEGGIIDQLIGTVMLWFE